MEKIEYRRACFRQISLAASFVLSKIAPVEQIRRAWSGLRLEVCAKATGAFFPAMTHVVLLSLKPMACDVPRKISKLWCDEGNPPVSAVR